MGKMRKNCGRPKAENLNEIKQNSNDALLKFKEYILEKRKNILHVEPFYNFRNKNYDCHIAHQLLHNA